MVELLARQTRIGQWPGEVKPVYTFTFIGDLSVDLAGVADFDCGSVYRHFLCGSCLCYKRDAEKSHNYTSISQKCTVKCLMQII